MTREVEEYRIKEWEKATQALADEFVLKYFGNDADAWWIADTIGGVFHVNSYFFDLADILESLKLDATFDQLVDYNDLRLEAFESGKTIANFTNYVNYGITYV